MRKEPFPIKNILDSLREDVQNGTITLSQAAEELHRAGWSNYIDEDTARRLVEANPHLPPYGTGGQRQRASVPRPLGGYRPQRRNPRRGVP